MRITAEQLMKIMPRVIYRADMVETFIGALNPALAEFEISTPARVAAFLAQIAHESGELKYWEETWGPTAAQKRYEGRRDLGNTRPGDGYRYRGRGPIQITGRANYRKYGDLLGLPLVAEPDLASKPEHGFRIAACFWKSKGLNERADVGTDEAFKAITRKINGGYTHHILRVMYWERAKKVLAETKEACGDRQRNPSDDRPRESDAGSPE